MLNVAKNWHIANWHLAGNYVLSSYQSPMLYIWF